MLKTITNLFRQLHQDDCGALIATEYLTLGSIVVLGTVGGLSAMRDATVNEMQEYGNSVRSIRQEYQVPGYRTGSASVAGSRATDSSTGAQGLACFGGQ